MSLDFYLERVQPTEVYHSNITHNLTTMAERAGIYEHLWHPDRLGFTKAAELIPGLKAGLAKLKRAPKTYQKLDSPNGWGTYKHFVPFVEKILAACEEFPDATVRTDT